MPVPTLQEVYLLDIVNSYSIIAVINFQWLYILIKISKIKSTKLNGFAGDLWLVRKYGI